MGIFSFNRSSDTVEAVVTLDINGREVKLTGSAIEDLGYLFNKYPKMKIGFNLTKGKEHVFKKSGDIGNFDKSDKCEYCIMGAPELYPILDQLLHDEQFLALHAQAKEEKAIRALGDLAYAEAMLYRAQGLRSYSVNANPAVRRYRTEQALRQMCKDERRKL